MTSNNKRSWKLQEFVAHSANVTCLAIGPSSGRVMVTGGEDKKVNMWAIGKPNVILSLSGHTTPIECVQFNSSEELVCAGSQAGTLKIWDLEAAKIVRTLSGHKANIRSLDFHPYGDFVASGSIDTTVRLWDVRRKGCIVSYKGHTNAINHLRFSPDGRWVISAGEDGVVKLWDLNAGKLLADFSLHTGPVNCVEFHPREFLVATGSSDRTVKFWDLETFALISSSEVEANPVSPLIEEVGKKFGTVYDSFWEFYETICFHPEGLCLFSGGNDSLRAYSWEPSFCYDAQVLGWGKVSDMSFSSNQLIGASYQATNISVWVASMNGLEDIIVKAGEQSSSVTIDTNNPVLPNDEIPNRKISPSRKSFNTRPKTQSSRPKQLVQKDSGPKDAAGIEDFHKVLDDRLNNPASNAFKPVATLSRSPPPVTRKNSPPRSASESEQGAPKKIDSDGHWIRIFPKSPLKNSDSLTKTERPSERPSSGSKAEIPSKKVRHEVPPPTAPPAAHSVPQHRYPVYEPPAVDQAPFEPPTTPVRQTHDNDHNNDVSYPVKYQPPARVSNLVQRQQPPPVQQQPPMRHAPPPEPVAPPHDKMSGLNLQDFAKAKDVNLIPPTNDEESTLALLKRSHTSLCQIMVARIQNLALVSRLWTDGDIKAAVETASSMSDLSVLVDIMNVLTQKQALWTLDLCSAVLLPLKSLFASNYESYVETASQSLKLVMKNFSQLIKSTLSTPPGALGVDLVREERYQKCESCYKYLIEIREVLYNRTKTPGRIGNLCKEMSLALSAFD